MLLRIYFGVLLPAVFLTAQGVQDPTLTGEAVRSATVAKINPFSTEADVLEGGALFQIHVQLPIMTSIRGTGTAGTF
jgi:hypothetical protein